MREIILEDGSVFHIDEQLHNGAPDDLRMEREMRCYRLLDSLQIKYQRVDHDRADTIDACRPVKMMLGTAVCKNLFLCNRQQTEFYLLVMPGDKPFRTKELSAQIDSSRLSFAPADKMLEYLDLTPGSVSVLGVMNDCDNRVTLLIDKDIADSAYFGCHPCINTSSISFSYSDLIEKILPATHHVPVFVSLGSPTELG